MTRPPLRDVAPAFVNCVLAWRGTWFVARLALVSAYLLGAGVKLADFPAAVAEQAHFGMRPAVFWAVLTITVELVGPVLILLDRWTWLGAGMLGVFTALAAVTANAFWTMQGQARFMATNAFFEHIGLVGGFVLTALVAAKRRSRHEPQADA